MAAIGNVLKYAIHLTGKYYLVQLYIVHDAARIYYFYVRHINTLRAQTLDIGLNQILHNIKPKLTTITDTTSKVF